MSDFKKRRRALELAESLRMAHQWASSKGDVGQISTCNKCGARSGCASKGWGHAIVDGEDQCLKCTAPDLLRELIECLKPPERVKEGDIFIDLAAYCDDHTLTCPRTCERCYLSGSDREGDSHARAIFKEHGVGDAFACLEDRFLLCRGAMLRLRRLGLADFEESAEGWLTEAQAVDIVRMGEGKEVVSPPMVLRRFGFVTIHGELTENGKKFAADMEAEIEALGWLFDDVLGWIKGEGQ